MPSKRPNRKRYARKKQSGIILNVRVSKSRKVKKFVSSSFFKKVVVLVCFSAIGVFGTIVGAMGLEAFFKDPRYQITDIQVYNQNFFSKNEILQMSGLSPGMYWFDFSVAQAAGEIERNPNIKRAQVERSLPSKVVLKVIERRPVALLRGKRQDYLIDEEGVVLPMRFEVAGALPVINGAKVNEERVGRVLRDQQVQNALNFLEASWDVDLPLDMEVQKINISNKNSLEVTTRIGLKVLVGEGDYIEKLDRLARVVHHLERTGKWADVIDLRFKDIVVKPVEMKSGVRSRKVVIDSIPVVRSGR